MKSMQRGLTRGAAPFGSQSAYSGATVPGLHRLPRTASWHSMTIDGKVKRSRLARHAALELILLCHAATRAMKTGHFPTGDEPAARDARALLAPLRARRDPQTRVIASPARVARQTAGWIAEAFEIVPAFDDIDYGRWRGLSIRETGEREPEHVAAWLADPDARPHGGESVAMLAARVAQGFAFIDRLNARERCIVVTHAIVVKVALAHALGLPLGAVYGMTLAPLSSTLLRRASPAEAWTADSPCEPA
jgi:broad specificity phosphatase PhoE